LIVQSSMLLSAEKQEYNNLYKYNGIKQYDKEHESMYTSRHYKYYTMICIIIVVLSSDLV